MLASIVISALLAGPAVAGLIPRQNTVITIRHTETVTVLPTSTVFAYSPAGNTTVLPFVPSGTASGVSGGVTIAPGLNPINGMPAAPPVRPSNKTEVAKSNTTIKPIVFTSINGRLTAIYKSGPATTFAVPDSPSSSSSTITCTSTSTITTAHTSSIPSSSADTSMPISFSTFSATKGEQVTVTNSPSSDSSTSNSSIATASSSYSPLAQAPPQPTIASRGSDILGSMNALASQTTTKSLKTAKSRKPAPSTRSWTPVNHPHPTATSAPAPPPSVSLAPGPPSFATPKPTSIKNHDPYPYPTKEPPKPKSSSTKWHYPYPSNY
jgi:hypothetical protein